MKSDSGKRRSSEDKKTESRRSLLDLDSMSLKEESIFGITSVMQTLVEGVQDQRPRRASRKHRRLKAELEHEEKQFKCGCGKNYLSYAALYTHTKVKHNGIFPEGTYAGEKRKQGRPKVA